MADGQVSPMAQEIAALGITYKVAFSSVIGGAVSAVLGQGAWWEKILRGVVGTTVAGIGHGVAAKVLVGILDIAFDAPNLPAPSEMEPIAAFLAGLVGMSLCQMAVNAARVARDHVPEFIEEKLVVEEDQKKP